MDALGVVVLDVLPEQPSQMVFPEDDDMVEKLSANTADEAFGRPILPGTSEGGSSGMDSESHDRVGDVGRENGIVVEDQEPMRGFLREGIAELLDHPPSDRVLGHVEMENAPPAMVDREPDVEKMETDRRHDEEVHPGDHVPVIAQEGDPALLGAWIGFGLRQVARDRGATYLNP